MIAAVRPALFLALVAAGGWFAYSAAKQAPDLGLLGASLDESVEAAFAQSQPGADSRRALWVDAAQAALQSAPRSAPDLRLAESLAQAAIAIEGRESLALQRLSDGRARAAVEAELRGRTVTERRAVIEGVIADLNDQGRRAGLDPPTLILAPASLPRRLERARGLFGPAMSDADDWFVAPQGRALSLSSLPGFSAQSPILYGDVRDVLVQGCALAQASGRAVRQCRVGFLPKPQADPVLAGLSLAVLGVGRADRTGARVAKAAYAGGMMHPDLARRIAFGDDSVLGREALLAALLPVLGEAGEAWTQPVRFEAALEAAARDAASAAGLVPGDRERIFAGLSATRHQTGAVTAARLVAALDTPGDADRLALISEFAGPQLLALHALGPDQLRDLVQSRPAARARLRDWSSQARRSAAIAGGFFFAALLLLGGSVIYGLRRAHGGPPGGLERMDRTVSRLILGNND